jgi:hypothetical protein
MIWGAGDLHRETKPQFAGNFGLFLGLSTCPRPSLSSHGATSVRIRPNDGLEGAGRNVVVGWQLEAWQKLAHLEGLGDALFVRSAIVAAAHGVTGYG